VRKAYGLPRNDVPLRQVQDLPQIRRQGRKRSPAKGSQITFHFFPSNKLHCNVHEQTHVGCCLAEPLCKGGNAQARIVAVVSTQADFTPRVLLMS
jgi:hypothetical protein